MWTIKKWWFIGCKMIQGMPYASAMWRWHLHCMEIATVNAVGKGMGHYKVITQKGVEFPNSK